MQYTFVSSFVKPIDLTYPRKRTIKKSCSDSGTPINMGIVNSASHKHSQIVYGSVDVAYEHNGVTFGVAVITTGRGSLRETHIFMVKRTDSTQWSPVDSKFAI